MSIALVQEEIRKFLERKQPEVLCSRGKWGVGKTYTWANRLEEAHSAGGIKLPRYSYVSLFGINSLDELKFSIFENVITLSDGLKSADLNTLDDFVSKHIPWRRWTRLAQSVPIVRSYIGGDATALVSFMTVRDQIVCIDDLERRGKNLQVNDVLGLISYLSEQRNCKIVLIWNEEQLDGNDRQLFERNLEKVVDISLVYAPYAGTSIDIAIKDRDNVKEWIADRCEVLGISNIRVLKRIVHFVEAVKPLLAEFDKEVLTTAVASIVLYSWSHDQPGEAPSYDFLKDLKLVSGGNEDREFTDEELACVSLLRAFGYLWTDDFDLVLMEGIANGYFDPEKMKKEAKVVHNRVVSNTSIASLSNAWRRYLESFADDQEEVLDGLYEAFKGHFEHISPRNLDDFIVLFKQLGRTVQAREMLDFYISNRQEEREFFDLSANPFGGGIRDPDLIAAFSAKALDAEETRDLAAWMQPSRTGWTEERIKALSAAPVSEYQRVLKSRTGAELSQIISNLLSIDRIVNATGEMKEIPKRAREALRLIGAESPINALRVKVYGISVEADGEA